MTLLFNEKIGAVKYKLKHIANVAKVLSKF